MEATQHIFERPQYGSWASNASLGPECPQVKPQAAGDLIRPARLVIPLLVAKCWLSIWISYATGCVVPLKQPELLQKECLKSLTPSSFRCWSPKEAIQWRIPFDYGKSNRYFVEKEWSSLKSANTKLFPVTSRFHWQGGDLFSWIWLDRQKVSQVIWFESLRPSNNSFDGLVPGERVGQSSGLWEVFHPPHQILTVEVIN